MSTNLRADLISDLYQRALATPAGDRKALLDAECGADEDLRQEVESLLRFESVSEGFLERPAVAVVGHGPQPRIGMIGRTLGPYTITAALGVGGMGEVYRARDSKLGREVAIKILPPHFTDDPERRARFAREARVLATLNHPNIGAIYGVEEADGLTGLVLELVEGQTLAERLEGSAMPLADALAIASQVAEALAVAHDKGIIHRDLKPSNIVLQRAVGITTSDLRVKVLDFGLAKSLVRGDGADPSQVTSDSLTGSEERRILGTPAYMSPEQARGLAVDTRTDIWAFGCVLFEMLTGKRPFEGETVTDTLARILERDPDWAGLPAETPLQVARLLRRCLQKDPARRLRDVGDALFDLDDAGSTNVSALPAPAQRSARRYHLLLEATLAAALIAALVVIPSRLSGVRQDDEHRTVNRIPLDSSTAPLIADLETDSQSQRPFSLSQDGKYLVYIGRPSPGAPTQLILRALDQTTPTVLSGTEGARHPFFSPDGRWIAYWANNAWRKISRTGGPSTELWRSSAVSRGGTWLADNTIVVATNAYATGLLRLPAEGGEPTVLTAPPEGEDHYYPTALPGSRAVLFSKVKTSADDPWDIWALDLTTGRAHAVIKGSGNAEFVEPGYLVYSIPGTVLAKRFNLATLATEGESLTVVEGVRSTVQGEAAFATSRKGTLVYSPGPSDALVRRSIVWVDRAGREQTVPVRPRPYLHPRLSPDDTRLAISVRDEDADLWVLDFLRASGLTKLTQGRAPDINPVWVDGGHALLFASRGNGTVSNIFKVRADASGSPEQITSGADGLWPISATPDSTQAVAVILPVDSGSMGLARVHLGDKKATERLFADVNSRIINGELSPDGRWLAYQSGESGRDEIYVRPFPNLESQRVRIAAGRQPAWCRSADELFYLDDDGYLTAVPYSAGSTFNAGTPRRVLDRRYSGASLGRSFDISRDGQRFLMLKDEGTDRTDSPLGMVVVLDWVEELKRLLPTTAR